MSPRSPEPILTVASVRHAYGAQTALRGVDLAVHPGEIYGLLGPNGAGKTTLIRAVCGRLKPNGGQVRIAGLDPFADGAARAALGLVPQSLALYGHLTVAENLDVFGRLSGLKGQPLKDAIAHAMGVTHIADRAATPVRHLSGGFQRRVNIAAAILHRPRLLVLDEPTVGVDPPAREAVGEVLRTLRGEGVAILIITHDLDQAGDLADRVGFLRDGRLVLEGEPAALIAEAFGGQMEVQVEIAGDLDPAQALRLAGEGLATGRSAGVWSCLAAGRLRPGRPPRPAPPGCGRDGARDPGAAAVAAEPLHPDRRDKARGVNLAMFKVMALYLWRDRAALVMAFFLPPLVFLIFSAVFAGTTGADVKLKVAVADLAHTRASARLEAALLADQDLRAQAASPATLAAVRAQVRSGRADAGLVIRADPAAPGSPILILADPTRAVAAPLTEARTREAMNRSIPDVLLARTLRRPRPRHRAADGGPEGQCRLRRERGGERSRRRAEGRALHRPRGRRRRGQGRRDHRLLRRGGDHPLRPVLGHARGA